MPLRPQCQAVFALVIGATLATALAQPVEAQADPGLQVRVIPTAIITAGGVTSITYAVENAAASRDSLKILVLDSPVEPAVTETPPRSSEVAYLTRYGYGSMRALTVGFLGEQVRPGERRSPFTVRTSGLPDIVAFWAVPSVPLDSVITDEAPVDGPPPLEGYTQDERSGLTVGVVPAPEDQSEAGLTGRLLGLLGDSCTLGWITQHGICNSLAVKIRERQFEPLLHELDAQRGKYVSDAAYFLLRSNAEYILARR